MIDCRFPTRTRVLRLSALALSLVALGIWVFHGRQLRLGFWMYVSAAVVVTLLEAHRLSARVIVDQDAVEDRGIFRSRTLALRQLRRARLYGDKRLWLYFEGEDNPVWLLSGMGNLPGILDEVVSRAKQLGAAPEVTTM